MMKLHCLIVLFCWIQSYGIRQISASGLGNDQASPPVIITGVMRDDSYNGETTFLVWYKPLEEGVTVTWVDSRSPFDTLTGPGVKDKLTRGGREASATVKSDNESVVYLGFDGPNYKKRLHLSIQNGLTYYMNTIDDPILPTLEIRPEGDIVYQEGQDVNMEVVYSLIPDTKERGTRNHSVYVQTQLVDPSTGDLLTGQGEGLLEVVDRASNIDSQSTTSYVVKTSSYPTSGLLEVMVNHVSDTHIVKEITVWRSVVLRPQSQPGPFPDGYLQFSKEYDGVYDESGTHQLSCVRNQPCGFRCFAAGPDIGSVQVYPMVGSSPRATPVNTDKSYTVSGKYVRGVMISVDTTTPDPYVNFTCRASSNPNGEHRTTSRRVDVTIVHENSKRCT